MSPSNIITRILRQSELLLTVFIAMQSRSIGYRRGRLLPSASQLS